MITAKETSEGNKSYATDRLITYDVEIFLRHNQNYSRDLRQALPFARNFDNG